MVMRMCEAHKACACWKGVAGGVGRCGAAGTSPAWRATVSPFAMCTACHLQGALAFTSSSTSASLTLNLAAHGLGPRFRLMMTVRNDGANPVRDVPVVSRMGRAVVAAVYEGLKP